MSGLTGEFLFTLTIEVGTVIDLGIVGGLHRRDAPLAGGRFEGPTLRGVLLPGGLDRIAIRKDKALLLDVRCALETDAGERIGLTYRGIRHAPAEVFERWERGEIVPQDQYYMRAAIWFETSVPRLDWLNSAIGIGIGERTADGPAYRVYRLL